jgi:HAD superfamily hydrolase (TIGR01484 family)
VEPLHPLSFAAARPVLGVFTDIDDTLTTNGAITSDALEALASLRAAGVHVVPITGRPVGWSEPFAIQWPVDAIVAENGAVALVRKADARGGVVKLYQQDEQLRAANFVRLRQAAQRIVREVPGAALSRDSAGRETDIAIDHGEYRQLPAERVAQVVRLMRDEGMNATVSSIHVNGWYGDHNKLSGARWIVRELFGRELDAEIERWVYVGDSTNDVLMFEHFPNSVGVANIRRFEAELTHPPRYITQGERGAGFAEVARAILAGRLQG